MIIHLKAWLIKKGHCKTNIEEMSQYFPKSNGPFRGEINVKVDLSNYAKKKTDLKNATGID